MDNRSKNIVVKVFYNDDIETKSILLQRQIEGEIITDEEQITVSFIRIFHGPLVKFPLGAMMAFVGLAMSLIPGAVIKGETQGDIDENGQNHEHVAELALSIRAMKGPLHQTRYEMVVSEDGRPEKLVIDTGTQNPLDALKPYLGRQLEDVMGLFQPANETNDNTKTETTKAKKITAGTTVSGLRLMTSGVGRALSGLTDPFIGVSQIGARGVRFFASYFKHDTTPPLVTNETQTSNNNKPNT